MKGNELLILAALGIGGVYLATRGRESPLTGLGGGGGGGTSFNLDLSNLLGGLGNLGDAIPGVQGLPEAVQFPSEFPDPSAWMERVLGIANVQADDILASAQRQAQAIMDTATGKGAGILSDAEAQAKKLLDSVNLPSIPGMPEGIGVTALDEGGGLIGWAGRKLGTSGLADMFFDAKELFEAWQTNRRMLTPLTKAIMAREEENLRVSTNDRARAVKLAPEEVIAIKESKPSPGTESPTGRSEASWTPLIVQGYKAIGDLFTGGGGRSSPAPAPAPAPAPGPTSVAVSVNGVATTMPISSKASALIAKIRARP